MDAVRRIKRTLKQAGISTYEKDRTSFHGVCFSVEVGFRGLEECEPDCSAAGKGPTRVHALASAYGELIEYTQNTNALMPATKLPERHGLMPDELVAPPDAVTVPFDRFRENQPLLLRALLGSESDGSPDAVGNLECLPFFNVVTGSKELLPANLIWQRRKRTGMAAGDTLC